MGNDGDDKAVSDLMEEIRAATVDYQVRHDPQTWSKTYIANDPRLPSPHPLCLVNRPHRRRGLVSDAID